MKINNTEHCHAAKLTRAIRKSKEAKYPTTQKTTDFLKFRNSHVKMLCSRARKVIAREFEHVYVFREVTKR